VAELCAIIYLAFRLMLSYEQIGEELGIAPERALRIASDAREHGNLLFSVGCDCMARRGKSLKSRSNR